MALAEELGEQDLEDGATAAMLVAGACNTRIPSCHIFRKERASEDQINLCAGF